VQKSVALPPRLSPSPSTLAPSCIIKAYISSDTLLESIFIGNIRANLAFADDRLVILAEDKIFVARLGVKGMELDFWR